MYCQYRIVLFACLGYTFMFRDHPCISTRFHKGFCFHLFNHILSFVRLPHFSSSVTSGFGSFVYQLTVPMLVDVDEAYMPK
jgi:hypothetical protein